VVYLYNYITNIQKNATKIINFYKKILDRQKNIDYNIITLYGVTTQSSGGGKIYI